MHSHDTDTRIPLTQIYNDTTPIRLGNSEFLLNTKKEVGRGGTCLVYYAYKKENTSIPRKVILKEFYPSVPYNDSWRQADGSLLFPHNSNENLLKKKRFCRSYEMFTTFFNEDELNLYTVQAQELIGEHEPVNGTVYMVVDYGNGISLEDYINSSPSLFDFFSIMKTLAIVLSRIHANGYIHMDLKPGNLLCFEHSIVRLMDTDSFLHKNDFANFTQESPILSASHGYTAPEVFEYAKALHNGNNSYMLRKRFQKMGERADMFSFGAIIYRFLFGEPLMLSNPLDMELTYSASQILEERAYEAQLETCLQEKYEHVPTKAVLLIQNLLRKTLTSQPKDRYASMEDILQDIIKILPLVNPLEVCVVDNFHKNPYPILGREEKCSQIRDFIKQQMSKSRIVCISGPGGIGKSALARNYAERYANDYDIITEVSTNAGIAEALVNIKFVNWKPDNEEDLQENIKQRKQKLINLCKKFKTLIIVHDYNVSGDDNLFLLSELGCDIILTSRYDWSVSQVPTVRLECNDLTPENAPKIANEIFLQFYLQNIKTPETKQRLSQRLTEESDELEQLLFQLNYHPLGIKLIARQMSAIEGDELLPSQALLELKQIGFTPDSLVEFQNDRDNHTPPETNIHGHLTAIFHTALANNRLTKEDLEALRYMTLVSPSYGISTNRFKEWTNLKTVYLNRLQKKGWIEYHPNKTDLLDSKEHYGVYIMPMVIQEALRNEESMICTMKNCETYLKNIDFPALLLNNVQIRFAFYEQQQLCVRIFSQEQTKEYIQLIQNAGSPTILMDNITNSQLFETILSYWNKCLELCSFFPNDTMLLINCYTNLSLIYYLYGDIPNALFYLNKYWDIFETINLETWFNTEENIINLYLILMGGTPVLVGIGEIQTVISQLCYCLPHFEDKELAFYYSLKYQLGRCLRLSGDYDVGKKHLDHALQLCKSDTFFPEQYLLLILFDRGMLHFEMGNYDDAIQDLTQALELSEQLYGKIHLLTGILLEQLANAYFQKGDIYSATNYYLQALEIFFDENIHADLYILKCATSVALNYDILPEMQEARSSTWNTVFELYNLYQDNIYVQNTQDILQVLKNEAIELLEEKCIQIGLQILEERIFLCRRIYGESNELAKEYDDLAMIFSKYQLPKKSNYYKQLAKKCKK